MTIAPARPATGLPPVAWRPLLAVGGALAVLLIAVSARYGYHRDELYFLQAGQHLAWGYPDQPPLTPALARLVSTVAPDSLIALRVPSALLAAGVVIFTGLIAREFGGGRAEQLLAACCMSVSAALLLIGHLFGTTMIDLFCWVAVCWIAARLLRGGDPRWWLALGAVLGLGILNKSLLAVLPIALLVGVGIAGPRSVLKNRWFVIAVILAILLVTPNLLWQNANGWPQLTLSRAIAAGESGSSQPRWLFLPYQLVLISPILVLVWVIGLGQSLSSTALVRFRCFGWAYALLFLAFLAAAGNPTTWFGSTPSCWPPAPRRGGVAAPTRTGNTPDHRDHGPGTEPDHQRDVDAPRASRAGDGPITDRRGQLRRGRNGRLAGVRRDRRRCGEQPARRRARLRRSVDRQLRGSRCHRPFRARSGTATCLQRAQRLCAVGATAGRAGGRRGRRGGA